MVAILTLAEVAIAGEVRLRQGHAQSPAAAPTSTPTPIPAGTKDFFSIGFIPDSGHLTQNKVSETERAYLIKMMDFFVEKREEINLVFVSALGDMVHHGATATKEWERCRAAYDILENAGIPFAPVHGDNDGKDDVSGINQYFPVDGYIGNYIGGYRNGVENAYYLIDALGVKMLLLTTRFNPSVEDMDWAGAIFNQYTDRHAIWVSHVCKRNKLPNYDNVFMAIQGHVRKNHAHVTQRSKGGAEQHLFKCDYSPNAKRNTEQSAVVRWYTFYPSQRRIEMKNYSVVEGKYITACNCPEGIPPEYSEETWDASECSEHTWDFDMKVESNKTFRKDQ